MNGRLGFDFESQSFFISDPDFFLLPAELYDMM